MIPIMNNEENNLLSYIPDFLEWDAAKRWINKGKKIISQCTEKQVLNGEIFSLEWIQIAEKKEYPFGLYQSESWRKFVLATFFADIISYPSPAKQVNFERLLFVMHAFPQGFRTLWVRLNKNICWPVGYTGFYPMLESAFDLFKHHPEKLKNRMVVPNNSVEEVRPYLFLFNFSVAPELKFDYLTKMLMKGFVEDIQRYNAKELACIAVSEDGIRIAKRFDMVHKGDFVAGGFSEGIYVTQFRQL